MDNTDLKKRRPYPTAAQKARLVARLECDSDLSNGKYSNTFSKNEAEKRWNDIADELNGIPGVVKTWLEWRKTWQDMKCSSKRKKAPKKPPNVTESAAVSIFDDDFSNMSQDSLTSHDDREEAPAKIQENIPSTPQLMLELEGNTVSVCCAKKEDLPVHKGLMKPGPHMSCRSTSLNNRRYTYDYFCQDNICRLCWSTTNSTKSIENDKDTAQKILDYIGVDVTTGTPKTVCTLCLIKVENFIKFKRMCQEADRKLRLILSNVHTTNTCQVKLEKTYESPLLKKEAGHKKLLALEKERKVNIKQERETSDLEDDDDDEFQKEDKHCSSCNLNFDSSDLMTKHNLEFHKNESKSVECYGCNKTFHHKLKLCKDTMEFCCGSCCKCLPIKKIKITESCVKMKKCEEPQVKVYKCQICSEVFKVHLDWRKHMAAHRKEMKYVCETCGRVLKNKKSLSEHMLIHTSNKQLKCPHCDYRATLKTSLVYHIRLHTGERPYACDRCPYTCVTSSNLRRHINTTHLGIRAFKCQICSKEYMYKRSLKEHITSAHQGKKENMCKRCGALYFRFEHLRKHILIKHRKVIKKVKDDYFEISDAGYKKINRFKMVHAMESGA